MDVFLQENGWELQASEEEAYETMIRLASGNLSKNDLSTWLKGHSTKL
jgi:death-on-curing protein